MKYLSTLAPHWKLREHQQLFRDMRGREGAFARPAILGIHTRRQDIAEIRKVISKTRYRGIAQIRPAQSWEQRFIAVIPGWEDVYGDGYFTPKQRLQMFIDELGAKRLIYMSPALRGAAKDAMEKYAFPYTHYAYATGRLTFSEHHLTGMDEKTVRAYKNKLEKYAAGVIRLVEDQQWIERWAKRKKFPPPYLGGETSPYKVK